VLRIGAPEAKFGHDGFGKLIPHRCEVGSTLGTVRELVVALVTDTVTFCAEVDGWKADLEAGRTFQELPNFRGEA
jgi:hypothetical protein